MLIILSSCAKKEDTYVKHNISIIQSQDISQEDQKDSKDRFQIDGIYPVKKNTYMYADKDENSKYDSLEEGSLVTILMQEEDGYVYVDYNTNQGYIKTKQIDTNNK